MSTAAPLPLPHPCPPEVFAAVAPLPPGACVELLQTHIGCVYLIGEHVFKLKKPVRFDFLDFTTPEQRRWACSREIELNRRLCPSVYRGLLAVVEEPGGSRRVVLPEAAGVRPVVDWCVWMRRMPGGRMLNTLLASGAATPAHAQAIAATLAPFYREQFVLGPQRAATGREHLRETVEENIREAGQIDPAILDPGTRALACAAMRLGYERVLPELERRAQLGRVVDGHGDLRAENICLPVDGPPLLFDCIEFNDRFRICDLALDAAYLAMEFDAWEQPALSAAFLTAMQRDADPELSPPLLDWALHFRAFVKAKVQAWIAADANVPGPESAAARAAAQQLFDLSLRYALRRSARWLVFCGPSGSGKSTLAAALARRFAWPHFSTDVLRSELYGAETPRSGKYSSHASDRVYRTLLDRAAHASADPLTATRTVVLDGTFLTPGRRDQALRAAQACGAQAILIWADCPAEKLSEHHAAREDLTERFGSEANVQIGLQHTAQFVPPDPAEGFAALLRVPTGGTLDAAHQSLWHGLVPHLTPA